MGPALLLCFAEFIFSSPSHPTRFFKTIETATPSACRKHRRMLLDIDLI